MTTTIKNLVMYFISLQQTLLKLITEHATYHNVKGCWNIHSLTYIEVEYNNG